MLYPWFKSEYSERSILSIDSKQEEKGVDSILGICQDHKISDLYLVEDTVAGYLDTVLACQKKKVNLRFGLRITIVSDMTDKSKDSWQSASKIVLFFKSRKGIDLLWKIWTKASTDGFLSEPRVDCDFLKSIWSNEDLLMVVPFYDSYLFQNMLYGKKCLPCFHEMDPYYSIEDHGLPFDFILQNAIYGMVESGRIVGSHSIYYKNKADFIAYMTYRCMKNRSYKQVSLDAPNLNHFSSDEFSFESYLEKKENYV